MEATFHADEHAESDAPARIVNPRLNPRYISDSTIRYPSVAMPAPAAIAAAHPERRISSTDHGEVEVETSAQSPEASQSLLGE
jgi:hypothetical protein